MHRQNIGRAADARDRLKIAERIVRGFGIERRVDRERGTLFESLPDSKELAKAIDDIYRFPLKQSAVDLLNKKLREGIGDYNLAELVLSLRDQDQLSQKEEDTEFHEPQIICSLGLFEER